MAHSIQVVKDKPSIIHDLDLLLFLRIMLNTLDEDLSCYPSLEKYSEVWRRCLVSHSPGTIDLELDSVVSDESAKCQLLSLLSSVDKKLLALGPHLSASVIRTELRVKGVEYSDYEVSRLMKVTDSIRSLVR